MSASQRSLGAIIGADRQCCRHSRCRRDLDIHRPGLHLRPDTEPGEADVLDRGRIADRLDEAVEARSCRCCWSRPSSRRPTGWESSMNDVNARVRSAQVVHPARELAVGVDQGEVVVRVRLGGVALALRVRHGAATHGSACTARIRTIPVGLEQVCLGRVQRVVLGRRGLGVHIPPGSGPRVPVDRMDCPIVGTAARPDGVAARFQLIELVESVGRRLCSRQARCSRRIQERHRNTRLRLVAPQQAIHVLAVLAVVGDVTPDGHVQPARVLQFSSCTR